MSLAIKKDAFGLERAKKANIDSFFVDHNEFESREMFDERAHANF